MTSFDTIDHVALLDRVRRRVGDKRVLALVKAFCKAGILTENGASRDTSTGTPQGGILSPLLANVALSVLDEDFAGGQAGRVERRKRRRHGLANYRLIRYADDFVVMVAGTRAHAEALVDRAAVALAPMGLRLSATKTQVVHLDEGFDFLGWHIQRRRKRGTDRVGVSTYPSKKALAAIIDTVRALTRRSRFRQLSTLLDRLNPVLRGWCAYFLSRRVGSHLPIPGRLQLASGRELAAQATPGRVVGVAAAPLPAGLAAYHTRREHPVQLRHGRGHPLPLPGNAYPDTMDNHSATAG